MFSLALWRCRPQAASRRSIYTDPHALCIRNGHTTSAPRRVPDYNGKDAVPIKLRVRHEYRHTASFRAA